ncbi:DNA sulfur modification protein DndB [Sporosarcina jeotgali]|uniref:DNA sulfur modification protein DndB n=1 Tax=Sporosarcina jeotgali TaxID=3020056 RepID=A0ABZ0KZD2_9BACL|nr:DNA sulfur modification protein DndB [Sporosarcina sp. B2O-1]WOV84746.1 DNA sulfur modification protein DndB [Sporosarcina sp. B2O-1]
MVGGVTTIIPGIHYMQFGKEVLFTHIRFATLEAIFEVDQQVQRQLDPRKRRDIRDFILKSLEQDEPFYFSPFVFSSRKQIERGEEDFELVAGSKLYIIDGQHRASAFSSALSHLKSQKDAAEEAGDFKDAEKVRSQIDRLKVFPVTMQVYLDLTQQQERQLFTDLNTERCEAHPGLRMQYDQRDAYIALTRDVAHRLSNHMDIEFEAARLTEQNSSITTLTAMRKCLVSLFEGTLSEKKGEPYYRNCKPSEVPLVAKRFFESWEEIFPKKMPNRENYVCSKTGIQVALAQTAHTLTRGEGISHKEAFELLKLLNKQCTWKHDDPAFAHMYDKTGGRIKNHSSTTSIKRTVLQFLKMIDQERMAVLC